MNFAVDHSGRILIHGGGLYRSYDTIYTVINLNKPDRINLLNCYPNPFDAYTDLYFSPLKNANKEGELTIYDSKGVLILQTKLQPGIPFRWNSSSLLSGIYIAKLNYQESMSIIKLLHY